MLTLTPQEQQRVDEAADALMNDQCPLDALRLTFNVEPGSPGPDIGWFECAADKPHRWPAMRDAGDWVPRTDDDLAAALDEYGAL